jgi:hypothetical protein
MNDTTSAALTRFDFANGEHRGSHLTLYANCMVHRGDSHLETLPLASITSVRVAYERSGRLMGWGLALLMFAILLLLVASPLAGVAASAATEMANAGLKDGVSRSLFGLLRFVEGLANALPVVALAAVLGGGALAALGWLGNTVLTLTFAGAQRAYAVRGRDTRLLDFTEAAAERLMQARR